MTQARNEPVGFNRWLIYSAVCGALTMVAWPDDASDWGGQYPIAGMLALCTSCGLLNAGLGVRREFRRKRLLASASIPSGAYGNARFATFEERERAGLHDPSGKMLMGKEVDSDMLTFLPPSLSLVCQAVAGSGKTSTLSAQAVFHAAQLGYSVCVSDVKPELIYLWAKALTERGFRVRINNCADVADFGHQDSNPFAPIKEAVASEKRRGEAFTLADTIGRVLIPESKDSKDRFWRDGEHGALITLLLCLAVFEPENCYPAQLWRALVDPRRCADLLHRAIASEALDGDLKTIASGLLAKERDNPEHYESHRSGAANALSAFKPSSALGSVGANHDFDPKELRNPDQPPVVLFDLMPSDQLDVFSKSNALQQTARLMALKRHREGRPVLFLADEATNLSIPTVVQEIELMRSAKISIALLYQSDSSLRRVYGKEQAESIRANCAEMYFSVADYETAELISKRIGEHTIKTRSVGFSGNRYDMPSENIAEAGRRLMPPEEILAMDREEALLLVPGLRPVKLRKLPWYEVEPFKSLAGENPNERHPKSRTTRLTLKYGANAQELGPPVIPDLKRRAARAQANVHKRCAQRIRTIENAERRMVRKLEHRQRRSQ